MATLSKRKRPSREEKPFKERLKISGKVFDDHTLEVLVKYLNSAVFKSLDYPVSQGKEAVVFRASGYRKTFIAVKIFKYETTSFHKVMDYIQGDPRFNVDAVKNSKREFVKLWARKEYANLQVSFKAGVSVPEPKHHRENVVLMEFIGVDGVPCALLEDVVLSNPKKFFNEVVENMKLCVKAGLVHADLSSFNILVRDEKPVFIDWAQAVSLEHPRAREFLESDCWNVCKYFKKLGVKCDAKELFDSLK
ncbi:serine protein kinase RIO [Candidatus Micrarchaeota archaeon]|nr:serine protein kinase RIO [Candidatus Micrarchaeota archaeon]